LQDYHGGEAVVPFPAQGFSYATNSR